jgi:hypothetical protein
MQWRMFGFHAEEVGLGACEALPLPQSTSQDC